MAKAAKTIESTFDELEQIIEQLENPEVGLEESFKLYQSGMKLVKSCNDSIDKVEKKILILNEEGESEEHEL
ncbi:exodeoxyribonuclease VII small subunit [Anaerosporobacter faecicola]|uniref:exodeoxyribonuclease VII small subunit n=1 Tax=Anaerosporobacter faecicola TaxID=2718714 RepID=UPI001A9A79DC|nr:exodeoxyribonuclease VII small subunit [Anaerosporobacter faecicola]